MKVTRLEWPPDAMTPRLGPTCRDLGHTLPRYVPTLLGWLRGWDRCIRCGLKRHYR